MDRHSPDAAFDVCPHDYSDLGCGRLRTHPLELATKGSRRSGQTGGNGREHPDQLQPGTADLGHDRYRLSVTQLQ